MNKNWINGIINIFQANLFLSTTGLITVFTVIFGVYWFFDLREKEVVFIESPKDPIKVKPTTSGIDIPHQDKEIYKNLTTADNDTPDPDERLIDQKEVPAPSPAASSDQDDIKRKDEKELAATSQTDDASPAAKEEGNNDAIADLAELSEGKTSGKPPKPHDSSNQTHPNKDKLHTGSDIKKIQESPNNSQPKEQRISRGFALQIATLYSLELASIEKERIIKKLSKTPYNKPIIISKIQSQDAKPIYRLVISGFTNKDEALKFSGFIAERGIKSLVLEIKD